jgi:hypothetical protein
MKFIVRGNNECACRHFIIAARDGYKDSMKFLLDGFKLGNVTKEELEEMLRVHQKSIDEMKSDQRDKAALLEALGSKTPSLL